MSDWFMTDEQVKQENQQKKSGGSTNVPQFFDIPNKGESKEVTFLDPDPSEDFKYPPALKVHSRVFEYREGQKYPSRVLCPRGKGEECPICNYREALDEDDRDYQTLAPENFYCYTILAASTDEDGEALPPIKQIRLTNMKQAENLVARTEEVANQKKGPMKDLVGLSGNTFEVSRPDEDFIPRIGVIKDYLDTPKLEDIHSDPKPFTGEELISKFESDIEEMQAFVDRKTGNSGNSKPKINRS